MISTLSWTPCSSSSPSYVKIFLFFAARSVPTNASNIFAHLSSLNSTPNVTLYRKTNWKSGEETKIIYGCMVHLRNYSGKNQKQNFLKISMKKEWSYAYWGVTIHACTHLHASMLLKPSIVSLSHGFLYNMCSTQLLC